jgi:hypothetical protein
MPPRSAAQILAEWHELAVQRDEASDTDLVDAITARIEQVRREYIEGTPPDRPSATQPGPADSDPKIQMKLRL